MRISNHGLDIIQRYSGLRLHLWRDDRGQAYIGYRHKVKNHDMEKYRNGMTIDEAEEILLKDIRSVESEIQRHLRLPALQRLSWNQFDALVSWAFSINFDNLSATALFKDLAKGDYKAAAAEFERWSDRHGAPSYGPSIKERRKEERKLFETPQSELPHPSFPKINWVRPAT